MNDLFGDGGLLIVNTDLSIWTNFCPNGKLLKRQIWRIAFQFAGPIKLKNWRWSRMHGCFQFGAKL